MLLNLSRGALISRLSVRTRLSACLGLFFLFGMFGLYVAVLQHAEQAANRSYDRLLLGAALSIAETVTLVNDSVRVDLPYAALDMLSTAPEDRVFYVVLGPDGEVVTGNMPDALQQTQRFASGPRYFDEQYRGDNVRFVVIDREIAQFSDPGWIEVHVGQTRRARNALVRDLVFSSIAPISLMTVIALIGSWLIIGWALKPLKRIASEISLRKPGDLNPIETNVPTEVSVLVDALNTFIRRLSDNIDALRSFIAEAAHQMRTPLAALIAQSQVADPEDPDDLRRGMEAVQRNGEKLTRLLNQLLSDSIVAHRSDVREFSEFDLRRIVKQSLLEVVPQRQDAQVDFVSKLETAPCIGDDVMIEEALKNIVHNAFVHGDAARRGVTVSLECEGDGYRIKVADSGPGVVGPDVDDLFAKFNRHNRNTQGFGLGLAIVKRVADSHQGSVRMENREGGGVIVELTLPKAGP